MSDLQKLFKYFNDIVIFAFSRIPLAPSGAGWGSVFPNNLALNSKDLKLLSLEILALKLVALSFEYYH